jgi:hypothetical protein
VKQTFLHLSDLHYRPDWDEETQLVSRKFFEDLEQQCKQFEDPYLVFSGDLVNAGGDSHQSDAFLKDFAARLISIGFPKSRTICVPGNHDICRSALQPLLLEGAISRFKSEKVFNDSLPKYSDTLFVNTFQPYIRLESAFGDIRCAQSNLGGQGWELANGIACYCLNTALCSFGGTEDEEGKPIVDFGRLHIDTRHLYRWIAESPSATRVLVMHHPLDWLAPWARTELDTIISNHFHLVFSGHVHAPSSSYTSRGFGASVHCVAPPLFTKKRDRLGYAFVTIDTDSKQTDVLYRAWTTQHKFVLGTSLSNSDDGIIRFAPIAPGAPQQPAPPPVPPLTDTEAILDLAFKEAITSYSSKKQVWIDRQIANVAETSTDNAQAIFTPISTIIASPKNCIIRAPKEFGLTSLGRYFALEYYRSTKGSSACIMIDGRETPAHRRGLIEHIEKTSHSLGLPLAKISVIVIDNWGHNSDGRKIVENLQKQYTNWSIILLENLDDCAQISDNIAWDGTASFSVYYLWALSRAKVRELVVEYIEDIPGLEDDAVTKKILDDLSALNIHRTPLNCLLLLKLLDQAFDDSPVNRTEMIGRVLYLLFFQYDAIPRYATRPDLKDCEYALGYVCEWLIHTKKGSFTKEEFYAKVNEYSRSHLLQLDCEVLFAFLASENILIRKGFYFEFRFTYWLYYFAAHRMHHSVEFSKFILSDGRYSSFPEIIEFYTGIDRRRKDAVLQLTIDLRRMNDELLQRTGIKKDFNPLESVLWNPSEESVAKMKQQLSASVAESSLPKSVKDAIADSTYDRARPYNQELAHFLSESTLGQLTQTMRGAARALRNSDHVAPDAKRELLEQVVDCWIRVCQVSFVISPVLAAERFVLFEDVRFLFSERFSEDTPIAERWGRLISIIPECIARTYQEDLFSRKLGVLFSDYINSHKGTLAEFLVIIVIVRQRPPGWERSVEDFIIRSNKNSYYLCRAYLLLRSEFAIGFNDERNSQLLRKLAAMAVAKHQTGAKIPGTKLIEQAAQGLEKDIEKLRASQPPGDGRAG